MHLALGLPLLYQTIYFLLLQKSAKNAIKSTGERINCLSKHFCYYTPSKHSLLFVQNFDLFFWKSLSVKFYIILLDFLKENNGCTPAESILTIALVFPQLLYMTNQKCLLLRYRSSALFDAINKVIVTQQNSKILWRNSKISVLNNLIEQVSSSHREFEMLQWNLLR